MHPARPATKDDTANTWILVRKTLIPSAAAARSFERVAIIRRPDPLRRRFATANATATATTTNTMPKIGRDA